MGSWFYYVQSLIMGDGYVNLLWKLLLMGNRQGKEIIYYIKNILKKKIKNWEYDDNAGAEAVNGIINKINE